MMQNLIDGVAFLASAVNRLRLKIKNRLEIMVENINLQQLQNVMPDCNYGTNSFRGNEQSKDRVTIPFEFVPNGKASAADSKIKDDLDLEECVHQTDTISIKSFKCKRNLEKHKRKCEPVCHKPFAKKSHRTPYLCRLHTNESIQCDICNKRFNESKLAVENVLSEGVASTSDNIRHDQSPYNRLMNKHQCDMCRQLYTSEQELIKHRYTHTSHTCRVCAKPCISRKLLYAHLLKSHNERCFECDICYKSFTYRHTLKEHKRIHDTGLVQFDCNICQKRFTTKSNLTKHMRIHTREKSPRDCDICHMRFNSTDILAVHMRTHTEENLVKVEDHPEYILVTEGSNECGVYQCDICRQHCMSAQELISHRYAHTLDLEMYTCLICYKTYATRLILCKHIWKYHKGVRLECDVCGKLFSYKHALLEHKRTHSGDKPFVCGVCHRSFIRNSSLTRHKRTHTGEMHECDICCKRFLYAQDCKSHRRVHTEGKPFECSLCRKSFVKAQHLIVHTRIHTGEKPYDCNICHMRFSQKNSLPAHMRKHTGEKPYECCICHKRLTRKYHLNAHMRIHEGAEAAVICDGDGDRQGQRTCTDKVTVQPNLRYENNDQHPQNIKQEFKTNEQDSNCAIPFEFVVSNGRTNGTDIKQERIVNLSYDSS